MPEVVGTPIGVELLIGVPPQQGKGIDQTLLAGEADLRPVAGADLRGVPLLFQREAHREGVFQPLQLGVALAQKDVLPGGVLPDGAVGGPFVQRGHQARPAGHGVDGAHMGRRDGGQRRGNGAGADGVGSQAEEKGLLVCQLLCQPVQTLLKGKHVRCAAVFHHTEIFEAVQAVKGLHLRGDHQDLHAPQGGHGLGADPGHGAVGRRHGLAALQPQAFHSCFHAQISSLCNTSLMAHTGTSGGSYPSSRKTKAAS